MESKLTSTYIPHVEQFMWRQNRNRTETTNELGKVGHCEKSSQYEDMSELSQIISIGPLPVKRGISRYQLISVLEQAKVKQLELQIEQCRELERLALSSIILERQIQAGNKMFTLQYQLDNINKKIQKAQKNESDEQNNYFDENFLKKNPQRNKQSKNKYNIIKAVNGKIKIKTDRSDQSRMQSDSESAYESEKNIKNTKTNSKISVSPTKCSNRTNSFISQKTGFSKNKEQCYEHLLIERVKVLKDHINLMKGQCIRKQERLTQQIQILKKESQIIDQILKENGKFVCDNPLTPTAIAVQKSPRKYIGDRPRTHQKLQSKLLYSPRSTLVLPKGKCRPSLLRGARASSKSPVGNFSNLPSNSKLSHLQFKTKSTAKMPKALNSKNYNVYKGCYY